MYNLLHPDLPHHDKELNAAVIDKCNVLLNQFMAENTDQFFSEPLDFLHERLDVGDPSKTEDGKFVRPFLTNKHYKMLVTTMLDDEGENVPVGLADLYMNSWVAPEREKKVELWELELENLAVDEDQVDVVLDEEQGIILVDPVPVESEQDLEEDELAAEEFEIDSHSEPKAFRLEVMLPIILAAAIILIAIAVLLLYHFVYKQRKPHPTYKLIDATDLLVTEEDEVSSYETF